MNIGRTQTASRPCDFSGDSAETRVIKFLTDSGYMANNDYAIKNHSSYKPPSHAWSQIFFRNLNSCISSRVAYP